jgi:putative nucleotidyltransferase with HDIG domain
MAVELGSDRLIDPLEGLIDIEKKQLRIVYKESFEDDPLRMLRAVQFAARFNFVIEPETFKMLRERASLIKTVSPERIAEELNKLMLLASRPSDGFRLMQTTGLLKELFPELEACVDVDQPGGYHRYDVFEHSIRTVDACPDRLPLRMAALFHDINKPQAKQVVEDGATFYGHEATGAKTACKILNRLRYSHDFIKDVEILVEKHMFTTQVTDKGLRRLIRKVGVDLIFDLLELRRADVVAQGMGGITEDVDEFEVRIREEIDRQPPFGLSDLAIDGNDVMELFNLEPGPEVGRILNHLMEKVLDYPEDNRRDILDEYAKQYFQSFTDKDNDT